MAASTDAFSSPATIRQVDKSFSKDAAIVMQIFGAIARPLRAFARVIDYLGRITVGSVVIAVTKTGLLSDDMKYNAMKGVISLNLHRSSLTSVLRPWYAHATRDAGTSIGELSSKNKVLLARLEKDKETFFVKINESSEAPSQKVINNLLSYHHETQKRKFQPTSAARPDQLAQLSEVWHRTDLSTTEKNAKSQLIINALPQSSLLRKKMEKHVSPAKNDSTLLGPSKIKQSK